jgi:Lysozyme like domain
LEAAGNDFVEVKMPLYPAIKLSDALMGTDTFDFQPQLTSEPTAPEAGHVRVFSGVDFNATPYGPSDSSDGVCPDGTSNTFLVGERPLGPDGEYVLTGLQHVATDTSSGSDDMGRSFDLVFPTQTAFEQREGNAVATESLEIAHEGFLHGRGGGRDDGWCYQVTIDLTEPTAPEAANTPGALLFSFSSEPTWTAIAMAESGGNTDAHAPHGEDSWGLWQIDVDPAQTDNPDTFDCSGILQWASGPAVQTGAWIADVTYEHAASQPESANNLKQIVLAVHALDAGECSVDICAQNSPPASPALDKRAYTAGHFALELEGHNASPTVDYGTGSFIIANVGDPATIDASLVFDSTGGDRSTVLPYIQQRATMMKMFMGDYGNSINLVRQGGEADDSGFVIDWTTGDGPKGGDTVGVIAIITPTEHGSSILEFSVENFPAFPQPENNAVSGDGGTKSDGQDDGWCIATEIDFPESVHALYDLVL